MTTLQLNTAKRSYDEGSLDQYLRNQPVSADSTRRRCGSLSASSAVIAEARQARALNLQFVVGREEIQNQECRSRI